MSGGDVWMTLDMHPADDHWSNDWSVTIYAEDISKVQWKTAETFDCTALIVGPYIFTLFMMFHFNVRDDNDDV